MHEPESAGNKFAELCQTSFRAVLLQFQLRLLHGAVRV